MLADRQGNQLSGATTDAVAHFDAAVHAFNIYRGDPVALADAAIACAPDFAMAYILKAYLFGLATEPEAAAEAATLTEQAKALAKTEREISLVAALRPLLANNWTEAAVALDHHNMIYPHDLVALQAGHLMDFYRASARNLRDRIARVLPRWSQDLPGYSIVLGMHAFGLEEAGDYDRAEAVGREAVQQEPLDCWAHHAVAHVMEMQGRSQDGIGWMQAREPHWSGDDNFFKVHNWWHKALYHLDLGQRDEVMSLYDDQIRNDKSAVALDLVDASALLWRMHMSGIDVGSRWVEVAQSWENHADGKLYPFNDWHAAMAYLGADQIDKVDQLLQQYRSTDARGCETTKWAQQFGLPLIEGFKAFWLGDYNEALKKLHGARFIANSFGGSHAQRDVIDWTLTEAAIRSGQRDVAVAVANERLAVKPHSPINLDFLRRAVGPSGRPSLVA
ncbi:MAG: tetratricopeptide repeat protein [Pseudomonadota bacterium]